MGRSRVYKTIKLSNGEKIVSSRSVGESLLFGLIKGFFKIIFYMFAFIFIIPIKLIFKNKKNS